MLGAGRQVGGTWEGDLYLRGSGDFTFGSSSFSRPAYGGGSTVLALALALKADGITQIKGSVLGDQSLFTSDAAIERLWEISAPLLDNPPPIHPYPPGSWGPQPELDHLAVPYRWQLTGGR